MDEATCRRFRRVNPTADQGGEIQNGLDLEGRSSGSSRLKPSLGWNPTADLTLGILGVS